MRTKLHQTLRNLHGNGLGAHLVRGTIGVGGLGLANKALALIAAVVLGRTLDTEGYGYYTFAITVVGFIAMPTQLGLPQLVTREIASSHARGEWSLMLGIRRRALQLTLLSVIVGIVLCCILLLFSDYIPALNPIVFTIALFLLPLQVGLAVMASVLRGLRRVIQGTWPQRLLQPTLFVLLILLLAQGLTTERAVALNLIATAIAFAVLIYLFKQHWPENANKVAPAYRTRAWIVSLLPFTMLAGISIVNQKTDVLMLGVLTTASDVGIYNVAIQGSMLVSFPLTAVNAVLAPNIARLHAKGEYRQLQRLLTFATLAMSLAAGAAALGLIFAGRWLLGSIFGEAFADGYSALSILCIGQLINACAGSVGLFLSMTGHEKDTLKGVAVSAILNVLLNAVLIPPFGMIGAAIATALSLAIWNIILIVLVYRRLGLVSGPIGWLNRI